MLIILSLLILIITPNLNFAQENNYKIIWQETIPNDGTEDIVEVISSDEAIYVIGVGNYQNYDNIIYKIDLMGNLIWDRQFGNIYDDFPTAALLYSNDILIVASKSTRRPSDPEPWIESTLLYAIDSNGNKLWEKNYEKSKIFEIHELRKRIDGNMLAAGTAIVKNSGNARDYSVSILSKSGDIIWNKTFGQDDESENAYSVLNSPDGGLIFTGNILGAASPEGELIKIDSTGNIQWSIDYGLWQVEGNKIFLKNNKEIMLFYSDWDPQTPNPYQIFMKKYSLNGDELLEKRYDPYVSGLSRKLLDVKNFKDSTYLALDNFGTITCINESGDIKWQTNIDQNYSKSFASLNDSLVVIANKIPSGMEWDIRISLLSINGNVTNVNSYNSNMFNLQLFQNYPNPFNSITTLRYYLSKPDHVILKIYNLTGQEIETLINDYQLAGEHKTEWNSKGLPSGIYLYRLQTSAFSETKKLILQK